MRDEVLVVPIGEVEKGDQGQLVMPEDWCFDSFIFEDGEIIAVVGTRFVAGLDLVDGDGPF